MPLSTRIFGLSPAHAIMRSNAEKSFKNSCFVSSRYPGSKALTLSGISACMQVNLMKLVFNGNSQLSLIDNEVLADVAIAAL